MRNKTKKLKPIPSFVGEDEERQFWETHDSMEFIDWNQAAATTFPNLTQVRQSGLFSPCFSVVEARKS